MAAPLKGIFVVALEQAVAAPMASSRLADAGARVIKLERSGGDFARGYDAYVNGMASYFVWNNRGKESCVVDLKTSGDLALVEAMLSKADVFIQNLAPGATDRLGLGGEALRSRFPRLVVCDIAGYSPGTPDHERKAYDLLVQADAGLCAITGSETSGPMRVGISICDIATGQAAYAAIVEALYARERTGQGCHIQLSLFDTIAELLNVPYLTRRYGGIEPPRPGLAHPSIAPYGVFRTKDGEIVISIQNDREWRALCVTVMDEAAHADDPRYATNTQRVANRREVDWLVQAAFSGWSFAELAALLDRVRIAYGRVSDMGDLMAHRSLALATVETPAGPAEVIANPAVVDGVRPRPGRVPALGEQSQSIRAEFAAASDMRSPSTGGAR